VARDWWTAQISITQLRIASLIETCKLTGVDPHAYLTDVITRIVNGHPNSRIDELLPWLYPAASAIKNMA